MYGPTCALGDVAGQRWARRPSSPISPDKPAKSDAKYGRGFPLLADKDHDVAAAYGVWGQNNMQRRGRGVLEP